MTAVSVVAAPRGRSFAQRVFNALRLHVANPWPTLITPWIIFMSVFALNLAIWAAITVGAGGRDKLDADAFSANGGGSWIYVYLMVVAIQSMNLTFSFALGMGLTRKDYYLGTATYFVALAVKFGAGITMLSAVEDATGGWGLNGHFFAPGGLQHESLWRRFLMFVVLGLFSTFVGACGGASWVRWRVPGLYAYLLGIAVIIVAATWIINALHAWSKVVDYLGDQSPLTLASLTLPFTVAAAVGGYALMRRATPRA